MPDLRKINRDRASPGRVGRGQTAVAARADSIPTESALVLEQLEGPQRAASGNLGDVGIAHLECVDAADPAGHGDVLLAVLFPCDGLTDDARRRLELPEDLAGVGIDGNEL